MIETRFKKTEVGEIPEDWEIKRIGEIAPLQRGFDLPTSKLQNGIIPVVYSNGICNFHNKWICKAPGLVTGRSGTIGTFTFLPTGYYWPHNTTLWVTSFNDNSPLFVYYLYSYQQFEKFSGGSGVPTLNRNDVHEKKIIIPPLPEQQRIATALSDIDALLSALNKKIEKKKLIKQGAMQQLLTGKKRLAGFTEPWEEKRLGDICNIITGGELDQSNYSPIITDKFKYPIYANGRDTYGYTDHFMIDQDCACVSSIGANTGDVFFHKAYFTPIIRLKVLIPINCISKFIYYYLSVLGKFTRKNEGGIANINANDVKEARVKIPLTISEQSAIATLLSDMDKEIEALEAKRSKYTQVKQGMMQQLLTGKIRLVD